MTLRNKRIITFIIVINWEYIYQASQQFNFMSAYNKRNGIIAEIKIRLMKTFRVAAYIGTDIYQSRVSIYGSYTCNMFVFVYLNRMLYMNKAQQQLYVINVDLYRRKLKCVTIYCRQWLCIVLTFSTYIHINMYITM